MQLELVPERLRGETLNFDLADGDKVIVEAGKRITARHVKQLEAAGVAALAVPDDYLVGRILSHDVIDAGHRRAAGLRQRRDQRRHTWTKLRKAGIDSVGTLWVNDLDRGPYLSNTLRIDAHQDPAGSAGRDLPDDAPGRAADQGRRAEPVPQPVLHLRALRPVGASAG